MTLDDFILARRRSDMASSRLRVVLALIALWSCLAHGSSAASELLPAPTAQAIQYQNYQDWFWCADEAMGLIVPLLILFSGWGARITKKCRRLRGERWFLTIGL